MKHNIFFTLHLAPPKPNFFPTPQCQAAAKQSPSLQLQKNNQQVNSATLKHMFSLTNLPNFHKQKPLKIYVQV